MNNAWHTAIKAHEAANDTWNRLTKVEKDLVQKIQKLTDEIEKLKKEIMELKNE
jgi:prefoldin subunit 5